MSNTHYHIFSAIQFTALRLAGESGEGTNAESDPPTPSASGLLGLVMGSSQNLPEIAL
jgi:hypothetical protein